MSKVLNILVACEESGVVTEEFRKLGHNAFSCDILETSGNHPEWHIQESVLPLLNGYCEFKTQDKKTHLIEDEWSAIIAFPPCTHLAVSGAAHFEKKREDGRQRDGIDFFMKFLNADCEHIAVENPIGIISGNYIEKHFPDLQLLYNFPIKPNQIIHPWMFGDNFSKSTCLWLKGLPTLISEITEQPELEWFEWVDGKTGKKKRQPKWFADAWRLPPAKRARIRSKTFPGVAKAMATQWSEYLVNK